MPVPTALPTVRPRSASRSRCALAAAVLGLVALAGCGFTAEVGQDAVSPTTPAGTASPEPATTAPSPPPDPTAPPETPAPSDGSGLPVLTLTGFGDLRYGMTPDEASQALGVELVASEAYAGMREAFECGFLSPAAGDLPDGIDVMVTGPDEGTVARVDVSAGPYRTESGIGIGDDLATLQALQPEGIGIEPAPYGDGKQVTVNPLDDAATTAEVFDVDAAGKVTDFRVGERPEVTYIEGCV